MFRAKPAPASDLGNGRENADSLTLEIGAVPEPASLMLLAVALAGLAMVVRLRRG